MSMIGCLVFEALVRYGASPWIINECDLSTFTLLQRVLYENEQEEWKNEEVSELVYKEHLAEMHQFMLDTYNLFRVVTPFEYEYSL